jgi:hypothetical protein
VAVVLRLNDCNGNVGLVIKDVVGSLSLTPRYEFAADDYSPIGEGDFLADLQHRVPSGKMHGWGDELGANVPLAEVPFIH